MLPADAGLAGDTGDAGEATLTGDAGEAGLAGLGGDATDAGVAGEAGEATLTGDAGEAALTGDAGLSMLVAVGAGATSGDDATGGDGTLATVDVGAEATVVELATVDVVVLIGDDTDEIRCSVSRSSTSRGMSLG